MKKKNKFLLKGFIVGLAASILASLHLYIYSDNKISSIKDNDCWNDDGY